MKKFVFAGILATAVSLSLIGVSAQGKSTVISTEEAKKIVLEQVGLNESEVTFTEAQKDVDDGVVQYELQFFGDSAKYEFELDAKTGRILTGEEEFSVADAAKGKTITEKKATDIVLADLADKQAEVDAVRYKKNRTYAYYKVTAVSGDYSYTYKINASNGAIAEKEYRYAPENSATASGYISLEQAKTTALKKAGFAASEVVMTKAKMDKDDGVRVYEIEFFANGAEYEFTIHAKNGTILEWDMDYDD